MELLWDGFKFLAFHAVQHSKDFPFHLILLHLGEFCTV